MGEGHGRPLAARLRAHPAAHFTSVDAAAPRLACARKNLRAHGLSDHAVEFIHTDLRDWTPPARSSICSSPIVSRLLPGVVSAEGDFHGPAVRRAALPW